MDVNTIAIAVVGALVLFNLRRIRMNQEELAEDIGKVTTQLGKVHTEVQGVKDRLAVVEDELKKQPVSPGLQAAVAALKAQVQKVDDLVPDAPTGGEGDGTGGTPAE